MKINTLISLCLISLLSACSFKSENVNEKLVRQFVRKSWKGTVRYNKTNSSTLIGLPFPYTVSSVNKCVQKMYYWDTYFINEGMILDGYVDLAKDNVDNMLYLVEKYGKVISDNDFSHMNKSQPPYLSMMVASIYQQTGDKEWLKKAYKTLLKEYSFWMICRNSPIGLNHYSSSTDDSSIKQFLNIGSNCLCTNFNQKGLNDTQLIALGRNFMAESESAWEFNPRFERQCENFCPIDLNSNLYLYETNFAYFTKELGIKDSTQIWLEKAGVRKALLRKYCYNKNDKLYYDYDYVNQKQSDVISAAIFSLMYAKVVDEDEAMFLVKSLNKLEYEYGITACEDKDYHYQYQWSFPNAWPPLYFITVKGLYNYKYDNEATRIARKYVTMVTNTYTTTGFLWEKYNVRKGNIDVRQEYDMSPVLGWTAGVFVSLSDYLENSKL